MSSKTDNVDNKYMCIIFSSKFSKVYYAFNFLNLNLNSNGLRIMKLHNSYACIFKVFILSEKPGEQGIQCL